MSAFAGKSDLVGAGPDQIAFRRPPPTYHDSQLEMWNSLSVVDTVAGSTTVRGIFFSTKCKANRLEFNSRFLIERRGQWRRMAVVGRLLIGIAGFEQQPFIEGTGKKFHT